MPRRKRGTISLVAIPTVDLAERAVRARVLHRSVGSPDRKAEGRCLTMRSRRKNFSTVSLLVVVLVGHSACVRLTFSSCGRTLTLRRRRLWWPSVCLQYGRRTRLHSPPNGRRQPPTKTTKRRGSTGRRDGCIDPTAAATSALHSASTVVSVLRFWPVRTWIPIRCTTATYDNAQSHTEIQSGLLCQP